MHRYLKSCTSSREPKQYIILIFCLWRYESYSQRMVSLLCWSSIIMLIFQANGRVIKSSIRQLLWPSGKFYFSRFNSFHVTNVLLEKSWIPFKTRSSWWARTPICLYLQLRLNNHWHKSDKVLIIPQIITLLSFSVNETYFLFKTKLLFIKSYLYI